MALPIEATPVLDDESWIHLCKMMEYWETHPEPAPVPKIDMEDLKKATLAMRARQVAMKQNNSTDTTSKEL